MSGNRHHFNCGLLQECAGILWGYEPAKGAGGEGAGERSVIYGSKTS